MPALLSRLRGVRVPMVPAVTVGLLMLAALPLLLAFAVSLVAGLRTTLDLFERTGNYYLRTYVARVQEELLPAEQTVEALREDMLSGRISPTGPEELDTALRTALAVHPSLLGVAWLDAGGSLRGFSRSRDGTILHRLGTWRDSATAWEVMHDLGTKSTMPDGWGPPIFADKLGATVLSYRSGVQQPSGRRGLISATIGLTAFARLVERLGSDNPFNADAVPFVLYGRDEVIAHPRIGNGSANPSAEHPVPTLTDVGDPILAGIWAPGWEDRDLETIAIGHHGTGVGENSVYLYSTIHPTGSPQPWYIGLHVSDGVLAGELRRLGVAFFSGLAVLGAALVGAAWMAWRMVAPVRRLAGVSRSVTALDLDGIQPLPPSRLAELDEAAGAVNRMVGALRVFARYVPRRLVERLMADGEPVGRSAEQTVTVLFCDIVSFTQFAEGRPAAETATALNAHFARLAACIEGEAGTIDKYMGDALMAFWNAPDRQPDHAERAIRAARAIVASVRADMPFRLRIGIHTGPALVGDLGAPSRLNYTLVGDTVNVAQRLEQLGRALLPDARVAVLIGEATVLELESADGLVDRGPRRVRGRTAAIRVYALPDPSDLPTKAPSHPLETVS